MLVERAPQTLAGRRPGEEEVMDAVGQRARVRTWYAEAVAVATARLTWKAKLEDGWMSERG